MIVQILKHVFRWFPPLRPLVAWWLCALQIEGMMGNGAVQAEMKIIAELEEVKTDADPRMSVARSMYLIYVTGIMTGKCVDLQAGFTIEELMYIAGHNVDWWIETFLTAQDKEE